MKKRTGESRWPLILILAVGFFLRAWGISFGLPSLYHADEPALVNHALAHGTGDLNPHYFKLPAFLNYYLLFFFGLYFLLGKLTGTFPSTEAFILQFLEDPTPVYLIGRISTGLFFGTLGIYLVYLLGKRLASREVGLLGAFFLASSFLHVRDSHYVVYDIPLATGLTACLLVLCRLAERGEVRSYLLFGIVAGLTTATKYNGALVLLPFLVAHVSRFNVGKSGWGRIIFHPALALGLLAAFLAYAAGHPFSLINFGAFWRDFSIQAGAEGRIGFFLPLRYALGEGMGFPLLGFGIMGVLFYLKSGERKKWMVASFILLWFVYISFFGQPYERYALPLVPFLCLAAAETLVWFSNRLHLSRSRLAYGLALALLAAIPLAYSVSADFLFTEKDVRTLAREWIEENIPSGKALALDYPFHQPTLRFNREQLTEKYDEIKGEHRGLQELRLNLLLQNYKEDLPHYHLYFLTDGDPQDRPLFSKPTLPFDLEAVKREGVDYLLITRLSERYEHPEFYEALQKEAELVQVFSPYRNPSVRYSPAKVRFGRDYIRQTAAATEGGELFSRERFGDLIEIYRLR